MARGTLIVEQAAVGHGEHARARMNGKPSARRVGQTVRLGIPGIHVGARHRPDHRAIGRILRHPARRQHQVRRRVVHATDRHCRIVVRTGAAVAVGEHVAHRAHAGRRRIGVGVLIGDVSHQGGHGRGRRTGV